MLAVLYVVYMLCVVVCGLMQCFETVFVNCRCRVLFVCWGYLLLLRTVVVLCFLLCGIGAVVVCRVSVRLLFVVDSTCLCVDVCVLLL